MHYVLPYFFFFFFCAPTPPAMYTLSLHDALPISASSATGRLHACGRPAYCGSRLPEEPPRPAVLVGTRRFLRDRKSTRLNSSHGYISYAVFCLKKKTMPQQMHLATANRYSPVHSK